MFVSFYGNMPYKQSQFVSDVLGKEFDKNVCSSPTEFVPKLAPHLSGREIGIREYIKTPPDQRFSHEGIKQMIDGGRIMMVGAQSHARIIYGYGTYEGKEALLAMDPNGGKPQPLKWEDFDTCSWVVWCKKQASG